ncbi:hypothetical protein F511_47403 [Dorcoceras hygrometricum]|uniref:Uncharacterized protein n=1 Tax=Dorcoceras hygrometricum TaxID=472368 RepID=A0A2Z6ZS50_9LAMI|nr:hypothetical protein F511_47403 [Dorcoceras hygrometricum]
MSSIKNPLAAILDSNKFTGLNYQNWLRNLNIVLASEKLLYTLDKSPPKEAPADISPEELTVGIRIHPPARQRKNIRKGRETINTKTQLQLNRHS